MEKKEIYIARDGKVFNSEHDCRIHEYENCMMDNEAFLIYSGFYGQFRGMVKTYDEAKLCIKNAKEDGLQYEVVSLGDYRLVKC